MSKRIQIYADGEELPESVTCPELLQIWEDAATQLEKPRSKDGASTVIGRRISRQPNSFPLVMPLGECSALDALVAKASGFELRFVVVAEVDQDGDGKSDETRELLEVKVRDVVVVRRMFKFAEGLEVVVCKTMSPAKPKRLAKAG